MKGFLATLFVVCLILGGAWFAYEPYIKPLLEGDDGIGTSGASDVIGDREVTPAVISAKAKPDSSQSKLISKPSSQSAAPSEKKSEIDQILEEKYPLPAIIPLMEIVDGWNNVPQRAFPDAVVANETISFQLIVDGQAIGSSDVAPGTPLKPQRLSGDQLLIANAANPGMSTTIPVDKTDFKQRITQRYDDYVSRVNAEVVAKRARVKEILEKDPAKLAALTGEAPQAVKVEASDPKMAPVKASLTAGDVASVTLEEAKTFTWNGTETIGGDHAGTYETVTVRFEVSTIFGIFPVNYKCLLQGGRVVAWIDPITEDPV